jgi:ferredoxin
VFIDFWNFSLQWRDRAGGDRIDWRKVPPVLLREGERQLKSAGLEDGLHLEETLVYASHDVDERGKRLKNWLDSFLDKQPSFRVQTRVRRSKARSVHCRHCDHSVEKCPNCDEGLRWSPEKGVDTAIVTDLLALAGENAFDVAILVSSDADFVPAVEWLQARGKKVLNATWANHGFELAKVCWASFKLDAVMADLTRPDA